jgi:hypothetical protein
VHQISANFFKRKILPGWLSRLLRKQWIYCSPYRYISSVIFLIRLSVSCHAIKKKQPRIGDLRLRNVPQGPLSLRFSGICPDAIPDGHSTAHQFAFAPDALSGLLLKIPSGKSTRTPKGWHYETACNAAPSGLLLLFNRSILLSILLDN